MVASSPIALAVAGVAALLTTCTMVSAAILNGRTSSSTDTYRATSKGLAGRRPFCRAQPLKQLPQSCCGPTEANNSTSPRQQGFWTHPVRARAGGVALLLMDSVELNNDVEVALQLQDCPCGLP